MEAEAEAEEEEKNEETAWKRKGDTDEKMQYRKETTWRSYNLFHLK